MDRATNHIDAQRNDVAFFDSLFDVVKYDCNAAMDDGSYFRLLDIGVGIWDRE